MSEARPAERPIVGDVIADRYRIEGVAGEGGMGTVYEAEHVILRERVAIKVLLAGTVVSSDVIDRFSLEARALASIKSEHVVRVVDAGTLRTGAPYLVMEYLEGRDLGAVLTADGPMRAEDVVDYALQALEALARAHTGGIIHRDMKPSNLFLAERESGGPIVKLLDFGVSKSVVPDNDRKLTGPVILGSLAYMSPEQLRKETLDHRSDLWSLGVVMYELLTGAPPFDGGFGTVVTAILQNDPVPIRERVASVPEGLAAVVTKCIARNLPDRWPDAASLASALAPFGSGAWTPLVLRIKEISSRVRTARPARHYPTYDNALQALEADPPVPGAAVADTEPPTSISDAQARVTRLPARPPPPGTSMRVLLIDDSEITLAAHDHLLTHSGFEVRTTMSPGEFEAVLEGWAPHLVLMDVQMPGISGDEPASR